VAGLAILHVALIAPELRTADLLAIALAAAGALIATTGWSAVRLRRRLDPGGSYDVAGWIIAAIDAIALIAIARVTIEIDPSATIVWAFVLWAPFSISVRATVQGALAGAMGIAMLVLASTSLAAAGLQPLAWSWTTIGVPMLLVFIAGIVTSLLTLSQYRAGMHVQRQLDDERDRALQLREADDLKNTFLAAVSHELRTPLTSILGFAVTMIDRPELDGAQRDRMLRTILVEAEHLEDILANLLDLDRLTRGKATLVTRELDPASVVTIAVQHVEERSGRHIDLDLESGIVARLDAAKVERIVENLVGNAVKYTPAGAQVRVQLRKEGAGVLIVVDDSGPGISHELRETIFEPFRRGADVGVPGTGIGLSLVDRFSRMHGGRAWVEERPGGGCRFQVFLASSRIDGCVPGGGGSIAGGGIAMPSASVSSPDS
jgi:signal transduction histidine kinase